MDIIYTHWVDFVIIGILVLSTVIGVIRGFVREVFSFASWAGALWLSLHYFSLFADVLRSVIENESLRNVTAFGLLFVAGVIVGAMISYLLVNLVRQSGLSGTDRSLGLVFGGARGAIIVALLVLVIYMGNMAGQAVWQQSVLIPYFKPVATWLKDMIPASLTA